MANNKEIEQLVKMAEATMGKILTQNDTQAIVSFMIGWDCRLM